MKDIDEALRKQTIRPMRQLSDDFTNIVIAELNAHPKSQRRWSILHMLKKRISLLSLGLLLIAGSAAAAVTVYTKPQPVYTQNVSVGFTRTLPDGNRVIGYNLRTCQYLSYINNTVHTDTQTNENVIYEIRKGSNLMATRVQYALQGECEANVDGNDLGIVAEKFPSLPNGYGGGGAYIVKKISRTSITVALDPIYNRAYEYAPEFNNTTFTQFYSGLQAYDKTTPIAYSDIKAGDTVMLYMNYTVGTINTGATPAEAAANSHPAANPADNIVYAIIKIPPVTAEPSFLYSNPEAAEDLARVVPCSTNPNGYCPAYQEPSWVSD